MLTSAAVTRRDPTALDPHLVTGSDHHSSHVEDREQTTALLPAFSAAYEPTEALAPIAEKFLENRELGRIRWEGTRAVTDDAESADGPGPPFPCGQGRRCCSASWLGRLRPAGGLMCSGNNTNYIVCTYSTSWFTP